VTKRDYGPDKGRSDVNIYAASWVNPYGSEHRIKAKPQSSQAQRLATVMRVIGHPLSIMRKWPEVIALKAGSETSEPINKAMSMAEQKAVAAHRAALEKSVEKLAARRDVVKAELDELEGELKLLLSMLKAAGGPSPSIAEGPVPQTKGPRPKEKAQKAYAKKLASQESSLSAKEINELARKLLAKKPVNAEMLATETGQSTKNAAQTLARLARGGNAVRLSRGVYGAA
jgi:membrane-associated HD superfamily phosphohydrolase